MLQVPTMEQARQLGIFDEVFAREYDELFYQYTEPQIVDSSAIQQAFGLTKTRGLDKIGKGKGFADESHNFRHPERL